MPELRKNEEIISLWRRTQKSELLQELFDNNRGMILKWLTPYFGMAEEDDLWQTAYIGLHEAAKRYEISGETRFATYLKFWVMAEVMKYLKNCVAVVKIPQAVRKKISKIKKGSAEYAQLFNCEPDDKELAIFLGMPLVEVKKTRILMQGILSLDAPTSDSEGEIGTLHDVIEDGHTDVEGTALDDAYNGSLGAVWSICEGYLTPEQNNIVIGYFKKGLTLEELSEQTGLSRERCRQIKQNALAAIRRSKARRVLLEKYEVADAGCYHHCGFAAFDRTWMSTEEYIVIQRLEAEKRYQKSLEKARISS